MRLELLAKLTGSGHTGCPSVLLQPDTNTAVVWSDTIDSATAAAVPNHLPGESGVEIDIQVILDAADAYRARHGR